jgi:hypothetical protein
VSWKTLKWRQEFELGSEGQFRKVLLERISREFQENMAVGVQAESSRDVWGG